MYARRSAIFRCSSEGLLAGFQQASAGGLVQPVKMAQNESAAVSIAVA